MTNLSSAYCFKLLFAYAAACAVGTKNVATSARIPKFIIGATLVSIATTLPEIFVSVFASVEGKADMAFGTSVGSVTANTGLILAISAIFVSCAIERRDFGIKSILIVLSTVIIFIFGLSGKFGIFPSIVLLAILIYYMYETAMSAKRAVTMKETVEATDNEEVDGKKVIVNIVKFVVGAAGIVLGADLLVENAKIVASALGVSDGIIAITIVAIGTSLPELITTITSIVKKQGDLGVGNIIGANIIDLVLILPICSFISGGNLIVEPQSMLLDAPFCLAISLIAVVPAFIFKKFTKLQGFILLAVYLLYIVLAATLQL